MIDDAERVVVELIDFPVRLYVQVRAHRDELLREFALLAFTPGTERSKLSVSPATHELVTGLGVRYAEIGEYTDVIGDGADRPLGSTASVRYEVPRSIGVAMREIARLFAEAERLCQDGTMLTVPLGPLQCEFAVWLTNEFINQTSGLPATPWAASIEPED